MIQGAKNGELTGSDLLKEVISSLVFGLEKCYLYQIGGLLGRENYLDHPQIKINQNIATNRYASQFAHAHIFQRIVRNFVKMTFDLRGH